MPKKQNAASGALPLVVDLGCGYITSPGDLTVRIYNYYTKNIPEHFKGLGTTEKVKKQVE